MEHLPFHGATFEYSALGRFELIEARSQQDRDVPMVVRIVGTNAAEAAVLLEEAKFETAASLDEAAAKAVASSKGAAAA